MSNRPSGSLLAGGALLAALAAALILWLARGGGPGGALAPLNTSDQATASAAAQLDASGRLELDSPQISAAASVPTSLIPPGVRLAGPGRLSGMVLDIGDGASVAGVNVELFALPPAAAGLLNRVLGVSGLGADVQRRTEAVAVTVADAMGRFQFEGVREGTWYVDVRGDYHLSDAPVRARTLASGSGGPVEVWVRAGGRVHGRVIDPDGALAAGARVLLTTGASSFLTAAARGELRVHETVTGVDGTFAFPAVPPGAGYEVSAISDAFAVTHVLGVEVLPGRDAEIAIHARKGATITGVVLSIAGEHEDGSEPHPAPLCGARVGAVSRGLRNLRFAKEILERTHSVTDEAGRYVLHGVPPGEVDVIAMADGHVPGKGPRVYAARSGRHEAEEFELLRGPLVSGRVVDAFGEPLGGVQVRWNLADPRAFRKDLTLGPLLAQAMKEFEFPRTDADGTFTAGAFPGDPDYRIHFERAGYAYRRFDWDPQRDGGRIEVVLARGGSVEGIVMDLAASAPVASYTIKTTGRIETEIEAPGRLNPFSGGLEVEDPSGRFRIDNLRAGATSLRFRARGYLVAEALVEVREGEVTRGVIVKMSEGATLAGVVQDADGRPVQGAQVTSDRSMDHFLERVQARRDLLRETYGDGRPARRGGPDRAFARFATSLGLMGGLAVTTDANGAFELSALPGGTHQLIGIHRDFRASSAGPFTLAAGERREGVGLTMLAGGGVRGRVTDRFDRPIEEGIVLAVSPGAFRGTGAGRALYQGRTDASGDYEILHMEAGGYFFLLTRGDAVLTPMSFLGTLNFGMVTVPEERVVRHDIVDTSLGACRVHGKITEGGEPLTKGALVAVGFESESLVGFDFKVTDIHAGGVYAFEGLPPGEYRLQLDGNGPRVHMWVEVPDQPEYRLDLQVPGAAIRGRVTEESTGEPVPRAEIVLRPVGRPSADSVIGRMLDESGARKRKRAGRDGMYAFERLAAGDYDVSVAAPPNHATSLAPQGPRRIEVRVNEVQAHIDFALRPGLELRGTVTDDAGTSLAGAEVLARRAGPASERPARTSARADGAYLLKSLAPGAWIVTASSEGFAKARVEIELREGEPAELPFELARGVLVGVLVLGADGAPVSGAVARLVAEGGTIEDEVFDAGRLLRDFFEGEATTDGDGRMQLGSFAPGKYELEVTHGAREAKRELTLPAGDPEVVVRVTFP